MVAVLHGRSSFKRNCYCLRKEFDQIMHGIKKRNTSRQKFF